MTDSNQLISSIFKSRKVLLEQLDYLGYDVKDYADFSISEINAKFNNKQLDMLLERSKEDPETGRKKRIYVLYHLAKLIRPGNIDDFIEDLYNVEEVLGPDDNLIIVGKDKPNDTLINVLDMAYKNDKYYVNIYNIHDYLFNILDHVLVPPHRIIDDDEKKNVAKFYNIINDSNWPEISRFDPVAVAVGVKPGEVVEIIRSSPTSLTAKYYRLCK